MTRGTGEANYTGNDFILKGFSLKMTFTTPVNKDIIISYAVIESEYEDNAVNWTNVGASAFFVSSANDSSIWRIDSDKHKVLKSGHVNLVRNGFSGTIQRNRNIYLKMNKVYKTNPTTNFNKNGKNYYCIIWFDVSNANPITDSIGWQTNFKIYYKDN